MAIAVFLLASSGPARANISGSAHDFSSLGWSGGEICRPCHTPHNANTTVADAPLWNHELSTATYTVYSSSTMDATVDQPGPQSMLCLSCHDGTVAVDSMGGATGSTMISGSALLGTNLGDDHPVGMRFDHSVLEVNPGCSNCHAAHAGMQNPGPVYFFNGQVECPTCHDVHNKDENPNLLVMSNVGSALCLHCHAK